jgi:hypothetical protein
VVVKRQFSQRNQNQKTKLANKFIKTAGREGVSQLSATPDGQHALAVVYDHAGREGKDLMRQVHEEQGNTAVDYTDRGETGGSANSDSMVRLGLIQTAQHLRGSVVTNPTYRDDSHGKLAGSENSGQNKVADVRNEATTRGGISELNSGGFEPTKLPAGFPVFEAGEVSDAELQRVLGPAPPGADSNARGVIDLEEAEASTVLSETVLEQGGRGDDNGTTARRLNPETQAHNSQRPETTDSPGVLDENRASMNEYWLSAQDNAVAQGNPIKYFGAELMRSLGNIGYGIAEMGVGLWENPGDGVTGTAKAVANFGPETFNFGVNTLKTVLDGYTLLAETAGLQEGSL